MMRFRGGNLSSGIKWIYFVSKRLSAVDRRGRSAVTSRLASLGVCFGVMALIVVMSVMNGFQMEFIDAIMEISSAHIRVENLPPEQESDFIAWCGGDRSVVAVSPFYEAQALLVGNAGRQCAAVIRAVPSDIRSLDKGFSREARIVYGSFDLENEGSMVLGSALASSLGLRPGSRVNALALSGSSDVALLSQNRVFTAQGIFHSGYQEINSAYAFINLSAGERNFGSGARKVYAVKLRDSSHDSSAQARIRQAFPSADVTSWREYNRSFFGALRVEKNMLMLLVLLIFVVVAINIYNAMRRLVFERREEIAVLSALGGTRSQVKYVFVMQGLRTGLLGAIPGLALGLLVSVNMGTVFSFVSRMQYYAERLFVSVFNPDAVSYIAENPMYAVYAEIPARVFLGETMVIFFFGVLSALLASYFASRYVLKFTVSEVLRNE